ncbi:MAG: aldo/keto reductase [Verrucomicrobia bacterium]|nr:aldo/keto reductase [Verrucomicrobiota bacterium]
MNEPNLTRREFVRDATIATTAVAAGIQAAQAKPKDKSKILNYNENMEYRRLGRSGWMISAVCMGGHWKRVDTMVPGIFGGKSWLNATLDNPDFKKNRYDVVTRLIEKGVNYIDGCTREEVLTYSEALRGRRDKMHLGFSWYQEEMRNKDRRTTKALLETLDKGLLACKLDYVDLWRITMNEQSSKHTEGEVAEMMAALESAKKQGKARLTGFSSHDRPHIKWMIETYPKIVDVVVTPYTAKTKELPTDSVFEAARKHGVGMFGIKPFASASLFKGDSKLDSPTAEEDDRLARMAIRYILCNPAITAPIPGLINAHQVDNVAMAVQERRKLDVAEAKELDDAMNLAWNKLPADYQWLKDWEHA